MELATQLGIDPWKFEQHKLTGWEVETEYLRDMDPSLRKEEIDAFEALREASFDFYYMPNG